MASSRVYGWSLSGHLSESGEPRLPDTPDPYQVGVRWWPLADLHHAPIVSSLAERLRAALATPQPAYNIYGGLL